MNFSKKDSKLLTSSLNETVYLENNFSLISSHKSQVLAVHGMATYAGWFEGLSEKLAEDKIVTNTFDLPAFGRSGKRGELKSHKQWIEATTLAWQDAVARSPKEMFLLGHSLGAVVSMASLPFLEPKPKGIILTVPGFSANYKTFDLWEFVLPTFLKGLLDLPDKTSFPLAEEVYESIQKGIHSPDFLTVEVKPKLLLETFALSFKAWVNAKKLSNIPLLMIVASGDPITDSKVAEQYFAFCNAKDKELKTFSINKHDLFILPEADETNCLIAEWILKNTSS